MNNRALFTIGHSNHSIEAFLRLLAKHDIEVLADVRSSPFSRYNPHFSRKELSRSLQDAGIKYAFFGNELGARPADPSCYADGRVQYSRLAGRPEFQRAIERLAEGAADHRIALMCAERKPLDCHRSILVSQALADAGCEVMHILADGELQPHERTMRDLLKETGTSERDLFLDEAEMMRNAILQWENRIAYRDKAEAEKEMEARA